MLEAVLQRKREAAGGIGRERVDGSRFDVGLKRGKILRVGGLLQDGVEETAEHLPADVLGNVGTRQKFVGGTNTIQPPGQELVTVASQVLGQGRSRSGGILSHSCSPYNRILVWIFHGSGPELGVGTGERRTAQ